MELDDWLNEINNFRITGQDLETLVNKEAYRINACGADVQIEMLVHMLGERTLLAAFKRIWLARNE